MGKCGMTIGAFPPETKFGTLEYWRARSKKAEARIVKLEKCITDVSETLWEIAEKELSEWEKANP